MTRRPLLCGSPEPPAILQHRVVPPLIGRGVLIGMAKHKGVDAMAAGDLISRDDIQAAAKAQGVTFKDGDIILFHTGWTDAKLATDPTAWVSGEPGLDNGASVYLAGLNPIAGGADTWGVEAVPPKKGDKIFYGHVTLLKENGIYILETMNTGPLVAQGVNEFMFVLGQARIQGAVQMIINPVAMWQTGAKSRPPRGFGDEGRGTLRHVRMP